MISVGVSHSISSSGSAFGQLSNGFSSCGLSLCIANPLVGPAGRVLADPEYVLVMSSRDPGPNPSTTFASIASLSVDNLSSSVMPTSAPPYRRPGYKQSQQQREHERGNSNQRGYGWHWQQVRKQHLIQEPLCRSCSRRGTVAVAQEVDHVIPKCQGGTDDADNLQSLCKPCHWAKSHGERRN